MLLLAGALLAPRETLAQGSIEGALDIALARAQQPLQKQFQAGVAALTGRWSRAPFALTGHGLLTSAADSAGAAQAGLLASVRAPRLPWLEATGALTTTAFGLAPSGMPNSRLGGSTTGALRLQASTVRRVSLGASAGYEAARLRRTTEIILPRAPLERRTEGYRASSLVLDGWAAYRFARVDGSVARTRTNDYPLVEGFQYTLPPAVSTSAYDLRDVTATLTLAWWRAEASARNTWRRGVVHTRGRSEAITYTGALRLTNALTLYGSHGRQLGDPLHGIPEARVSTVALRVGFGSRFPGRASTSPRRPARDAEVQLADALPDAAAREIVIRVRAPHAATVEAAGDWNDWTPVPLVRTGDAWEARIALPSGAHRIAIRVDGTPWRAPRGTTKTVDEFGVEAGAVVVP